MEKKSTFLPYRVKKDYPTLEVDTFKVTLLLFYLASLDNKSRIHDFKSPLLDVETTIVISHNDINGMSHLKVVGDLLCLPNQIQGGGWLGTL